MFRFWFGFLSWNPFFQSAAQPLYLGTTNPFSAWQQAEFFTFFKRIFFLLILLIGFCFFSKAKVGAFLSTPTLPPNHFMAFLAFLAPSCKENGPFSPHHLVFATINLHNEVGQKKTHGRCQCGGVSPLCQKPPRSRVALTNENQSALCWVVLCCGQIGSLLLSTNTWTQFLCFVLFHVVILQCSFRLILMFIRIT